MPMIHISIGGVDDEEQHDDGDDRQTQYLTPPRDYARGGQ